MAKLHSTQTRGGSCISRGSKDIRRSIYMSGCKNCNMKCSFLTWSTQPSHFVWHTHNLRLCYQRLGKNDVPSDIQATTVTATSFLNVLVLE